MTETFTAVLRAQILTAADEAPASGNGTARGGVPSGESSRMTPHHIPVRQPPAEPPPFQPGVFALVPLPDDRNPDSLRCCPAEGRVMPHCVTAPAARESLPRTQFP